MNHFVYNTLNALYLGISKESFLVLKKWYSTQLFNVVYSIFSLSTFQNLERLEREKIYDQINELRISNISLVEKKKWLVTCLEQLENHEVLKRTLKINVKNDDY